MSNFASILSNIIRERGMTQKEVADACGVFPPTLNRYASGKNKSPNVDILIKIAKSLNVSTDYLLGLTDIENCKPEITVEERILLSAFRKASGRDIAVIWQLLDPYLSPNEKESLSQSNPTQDVPKVG